jgi:hypothetical protein
MGVPAASDPDPDPVAGSGDGWSGIGRQVLTDRLMVAAMAAAAAAATCFAVAPAGWQEPTLRLANPVLCGLTAAGQWRVSRDRALSGPAARFWRLLAGGLGLFALGMAVDLGVHLLGLAGGRFGQGLGETTLFPLAGLVVLIALAVVPTPIRTTAERITIGLDVATVLFGATIFVWYFLVSPRWHPSADTRTLAYGAVLPALTLVAGFAVLRIAAGDRSAVKRPTALCFAAVAAVEVVSITVAPRRSRSPAGSARSCRPPASPAACSAWCSSSGTAPPLGRPSRPAGTGRLPCCRTARPSRLSPCCSWSCRPGSTRTAGWSRSGWSACAPW